MKKTLVVLVLIGLFSITTQGAVIYVDAESGVGGNTVNATTSSETDWVTTAAAIDNLWRARTGLSNNPSFTLGAPGNDILESSGTYGGEDCPAIMTTISGLNPGETYGVSVVYWCGGSPQNWAIRAGFDLNNLLYFDRSGADGAVAGTLSGKIEADRMELLGYLGKTVANGNGQIKVYINDKPGTSYVDRTWYDGLLVPEPATLALMAIGGICLRRRKA